MRKTETKGNCECCVESIDVQLYVGPRGMLQCESCYNKDRHIIEQQTTTMLENSRTIDNAIVLKTDIFLAKTTAAVELRAAIDQNPSIPDEQKEYEYAKICMERFKHLQEVIFNERAALLEKENELRMWQVNVQTAAGKLRTDLRAQFKELDINYQPVVPKTPKPKSTSSGSNKGNAASFKKQELNDAATKYGVDAYLVRITMVSRNMNAETAAKHLADTLKSADTGTK